MIQPKVLKEDCKNYWKRSEECTSSSIFSLHFGHWKVAADSNFLSEMNTLFTEIVVLAGYSPNRWQQGLLVADAGEEARDSTSTEIVSYFVDGGRL